MAKNVIVLYSTSNNIWSIHIFKFQIRKICELKFSHQMTIFLLLLIKCNKSKWFFQEAAILIIPGTKLIKLVTVTKNLSVFITTVRRTASRFMNNPKQCNVIIPWMDITFRRLLKILEWNKTYNCLKLKRKKWITIWIISCISSFKDWIIKLIMKKTLVEGLWPLQMKGIMEFNLLNILKK